MYALDRLSRGCSGVTLRLRFCPLAHRAPLATARRESRRSPSLWYSSGQSLSARSEDASRRPAPGGASEQVSPRELVAPVCWLPHVNKFNSDQQEVCVAVAVELSEPLSPRGLVAPVRCHMP